MKKTLSLILIFTLTAQVPVLCFGQSSAQEDANDLAECIERKFVNLKAEIEKIENKPVVLNEEIRLEYSKLVIKDLLFGFDISMKSHVRAGTFTAGVSLVSGSIAYYMYLRGVKAKSASEDLMKRYGTAKYSSVELAEMGGETAVKLENELYKMRIKNGKIFSRAFGIVSILIGGIAYSIYKSFEKNLSAYEESESTISDILNAKSMDQFNKALNSNNEMIVTMRDMAAINCEIIPASEFLRLIPSVVYETAQEQKDTLQEIQILLDSLPKQ